jgi:hypothetical protein
MHLKPETFPKAFSIVSNAKYSIWKTLMLAVKDDPSNIPEHDDIVMFR